ncbi:MAG: hypothetical protein IK092_06675 [Muribaculaceae bacterium]|nr:hypothetical protein [Muribaculaceae bacterium]
MILSQYIQELLKRKSGINLRSPSDAELLTLDIERTTGEHVGVNTIKRLLGMIADERHPRTTTLDIIARYLDYESWEVLITVSNHSNSGFGTAPGELHSNTLPEDAEVEFSYYPGRRVLLRYQGNSLFKVVKSENSKLQEGDIIEADFFNDSYPLYVKQVIRHGQAIGAFTAGKVSGIKFTIKEL